MLFTWWNAYYVIKDMLEKAEPAFDIRLNNNREDTKIPNAILPCRHFQQEGRKFNSHAKFVIIDKLVNTSSSKEIYEKA